MLRIPRLGSLVKLENFLKLDAEGIAKIWTDWTAQSKGSSSFALTLPAAQSRLLWERVQQYPSFILPIDRLTGQEIMYIQATTEDHNFALQATPLEAIKRAPTNAPSALSLTFFGELIEEKGVGLLSGNFDGHQLNRTQVSQLLERFLAVYSGDSALLAHLRAFNCTPDDFSFQDYFSAINADNK